MLNQMAQTAAVAQNLQDTLAFTIAHNDIEKRVNQMLANKAKTFKMAGFRPGKVPVNMVRDRFFGTCLEDAINFLINQQTKSAVASVTKRLALQPACTIQDSYEYGKDLQLTLSLEYMPTFEVEGYESIKIERLKNEVEQAEIDAIFKNYEKELPVYKDATNGEAITADDLVWIQVAAFDSKTKEFTVNEEAPIVRYAMNGEHELIPGLANAILGSKLNEFVSHNVPGNKKNKDAMFHVKIAKHRIPTDEKQIICELALEKTPEEIEMVRSKLAEDFKKSRDRDLYLYSKRQLLDKLAEQYSFDLPPSLVDMEFKSIWNHLQVELKENGNPEEVTEEEMANMEGDYKKIAERRVRLGLIIAEIARQQKIEITPQEVNYLVQQEARRYSDPHNVITYFRKNRSAVEALVAPYIEDRVVQFILSKDESEPTNIAWSDAVAKFKGVLPGYDEEDEEVAQTETAKKPAKKSAKAKEEKTEGEVEATPKKKAKAKAEAE